MKPAEKKALVQIEAELRRMDRYDDESIVHDKWLRQRYDCCFPGLAVARKATVRTAWHEAGHAVAALQVGARFSSASIYHGHGSEGRVNGIRADSDLAFVVDAAGQIAEHLMDWTLLERDEELRAWLPGWKGDGGDAWRFRRRLVARFGQDELAAWRYSEQLLVPRRLAIRQVARGMLVHPRHLPYTVVAGLADGR
jgi:hypothetical protein